MHQVGKRARENGRVFQLRQGSSAAVSHGRADVQQHMALEVRLFFEFLDVVTVAAGVDPPVDRRQVIPRQVLPVLGKLDAEAPQRAAVKTGEKPFHHRPGLQLHGSQPRNNGRVQKPEVTSG